MSPSRNDNTDQNRARDEALHTSSSFYERSRRQSCEQIHSRHGSLQLQPILGSNEQPRGDIHREEILTPNRTWQPGEYLPSSYNAPQPDFFTLLSQMQGSITAEIRKVQASVEVLAGRVNKLEKDLMGTTEQLHLCQTPPSSSSADPNGDKSMRKKRTPIALSVSD